MPEFDPHAAIKRLAEAERPCRCADMVCTIAVKQGLPHVLQCGCAGTGLIVPFAALRVQRLRGYSHLDCIGRNYCTLTVLSFLEIQDCQGLGWQPEPAVEKAYWRVLQVLPADIVVELLTRAFPDSPKLWGKALLLAAESWVKEQHG